jgi:hypothetical protein
MSTQCSKYVSAVYAQRRIWQQVQQRMHMTLGTDHNQREWPRRQDLRDHYGSVYSVSPAQTGSGNHLLAYQKAAVQAEPFQMTLDVLPQLAVLLPGTQAPAASAAAAAADASCHAPCPLEASRPRFLVNSLTWFSKQAFSCLQTTRNGRQWCTCCQVSPEQDCEL